jgi:hypothetical protein
VPLVLKEEDIEVPFIEPLQILSEVSIVKAGYELKSYPEPLFKTIK